MKVIEGSDVINIDYGYKMPNFIIEALGQGKGIIYTPKKHTVYPYMLLLSTKTEAPKAKINKQLHDFYDENHKTKINDEIEVKYYVHFEQIEHCERSIDVDLLDKYSIWDKKQVKEYV